jgi:hypothetical protein
MVPQGTNSHRFGRSAILLIVDEVDVWSEVDRPETARGGDARRKSGALAGDIR